MDKNRKRIIIVAVYLVVLVLIVWFIYAKTRPIQTCADKIKNQNEEDVDCGGICAPCKKINTLPLQAGEAGIVSSGVSGEYDFYGAVANPNNTFGSSEFKYKIALKDASGAVIAQKEGSSFILPGEKKYIVENNIPSSTMPASAEFTITDTAWTEFTGYYEKPDLQVVNKNFNLITSGVGFAEAKGLLKNKSPFAFDLIAIEIIVRDTNGKIIALNSTQMRTVQSGEERDFRALWPNRFPGGESVGDMEAQVEVNIFRSDAFFKKYSAAQRF